MCIPARPDTRLDAARVVLACVVAIGACSEHADTELPPPFGPWLALDAIQLAGPRGEVSLARADSGWVVEGTPFAADPRRVDAIERVFRGPIAILESRDARTTGPALGLDARAIHVRITPRATQPAAIDIGVSTPDGTWVSWPGSASVHRVDAPLRRLFDAAPTDWRSDRLCALDPDDVVALSATDGRASASLTLRHGSWHSERPPLPSSAERDLRVAGLLRALCSARGEPTAECVGPASAAVSMQTPHRSTTIALARGAGSQTARCVFVDQLPGFVVGAELADLLRTAARVLAAPTLPDLGSPDSRGSVRISVGDGGAHHAEIAALERGYARALTGLRPAAGAPLALTALAGAAPATRTIVLERDGTEPHTIRLWWFDGHDPMLARVDDGPVFVVRGPRALARPLDASFAPPLNRPR